MVIPLLCAVGLVLIAGWLEYEDEDWAAAVTAGLLVALLFVWLA